MTIYYYFNLWKNQVKAFKAYDLWCQTNDTFKPPINLNSNSSPSFTYLSDCDCDI